MDICCHTAVLDKDSKFFGICRKARDHFSIICHILSGGNHNPILVESVNRYINKGLKITTNEHESIQIALKAILFQDMLGICAPCPG